MSDQEYKFVDEGDDDEDMSVLAVVSYICPELGKAILSNGKMVSIKGYADKYGDSCAYGPRADKVLAGPFPNPNDPDPDNHCFVWSKMSAVYLSRLQ